VRIKGLAVFEHTVDQMDQLVHRRADDRLGNNGVRHDLLIHEIIGSDTIYVRAHLIVSDPILHTQMLDRLNKK
jgi:hypothetical protein